LNSFITYYNIKHNKKFKEKYITLKSISFDNSSIWNKDFNDNNDDNDIQLFMMYFINDQSSTHDEMIIMDEYDNEEHHCYCRHNRLIY